MRFPFATSSLLCVSMFSAAAAEGTERDSGRLQHSGWLASPSARIVLVQSADEFGESPSLVEGLNRMNREQLLMKKAELQSDLPGFAGPAWLFVLATAESVSGAYLVAAGANSILLGSLGLVFGAVAAIIGVVLLIYKLKGRAEIGAQIAEVDARLESYVSPPPQPERVPLPPPPPSFRPQVMVLDPAAPLMLVARF